MAMEGQRNMLFRVASVLSIISVLWICAALFLADSLDSMTIDQSWKDGAYFGWIGSSILALDLTVTLWGMFWVMRLIGRTPVPYIAVAVILFFISTPVASMISPFETYVEADIQYAMLYSIILSSAVIGALLWGMVLDSWALGEKMRGPSVLKMIAATVLALGVIPVIITLSNIFTIGFSG
ncbi:MAG: hypothetical protein LLG16_00085 [Euryarchaeota archaeon]|nr:hypothetical protein [Euryarchaeota archaeon]